MEASEQNRRIYEWKSVAQIHDREKGLILPEVMILVRYREAIVDKQILDIGCGTGRTSRCLLHLSPHYTGIDYSSTMVDFCRKSFGAGPGRFLKCDARDLSPFQDGEMDFVLFSYNGLDSIDHDGRLKALSEVRRVLREGGLFVFSSHNRQSENIQYYPKLSRSGNPFRQAKHLWRYLVRTHNFRKNRAHHRFEKEYMLITDRGLDYSLIHYYIDRATQVAQLNSCGLQVIDMYDVLGNRLMPDGDDSRSNLIYYVAERKSGNSPA